MSKLVLNVKYLLFFIFFICSWVLQFGAHSRYYKGALTQKWSFLVLCTTFKSDFLVGWKNQNKHSTLNLSFDALSKWHDQHINIKDSFPHYIVVQKSIQFEIAYKSATNILDFGLIYTHWYDEIRWHLRPFK